MRFKNRRGIMGDLEDINDELKAELKRMTDREDEAKKIMEKINDKLRGLGD